MQWILKLLLIYRGKKNQTTGDISKCFAAADLLGTSLEGQPFHTCF